MSVWFDLAFWTSPISLITIAAGRRVHHRRCERRDKQLALIARCDQQHEWVLAGDDRGLFGHPEPPGQKDGSAKPRPRPTISPDGTYRAPPNEAGLIGCLSKDGKRSWFEFSCIDCGKTKEVGVRQGESKNWRCQDCQDRMERIRVCYHCKGRQEPLYFLGDSTYRHPQCVQEATKR